MMLMSAIVVVLRSCSRLSGPHLYLCYYDYSACTIECQEVLARISGLWQKFVKSRCARSPHGTGRYPGCSLPFPPGYDRGILDHQAREFDTAADAHHGRYEPNVWHSGRLDTTD